jgi:choline kinase
MEAIILAAGIGSRLAPLTNNFPKSLVLVNGKPILQYQIESYLNAGIKKINIVSGYKAEKIDDFIQNEYKGQLGLFNIIRNNDYLVTNNMYSLYLAFKEIEATDLFISNADVVIKRGLVRKLLENPVKSGIAYQKDNYNDESMKIQIGMSNLVECISKKIDELNAAGTSIDFYKFDSTATIALKNEINETIEIKKDLNSWTEVAINNILKSTEIYPIDIENEFWYEIDNLTDLENAEKGII